MLNHSMNDETLFFFNTYPQNSRGFETTGLKLFENQHRFTGKIVI